MIGNHAVTGGPFALRFYPRKAFARSDQVAEGVGIVIVMNSLHHRSNTLDPHARIDARLRQVADDLVVFLRELHEDEIPDFDEAVAVLFRRSGRTAPDVVTMIVEDFRAWPAGTVRTHGPEIVLGRDTDDLFVGETGPFLPQVEGFVVRVIDGDQQTLWIKAPFLGQERPGVIDRLFLEIVAEREIPEHFEEGVMPCGIADIVEIIVLAPSADAFLRAGRTRRRRRFESGKGVLERHHAGVDEHQRRVTKRDERRAGDFRVFVLREIVEKAAADVVGRCHKRAVRQSAAKRQARMTGQTVQDWRSAGRAGSDDPAGCGQSDCSILEMPFDHHTQVHERRRALRVLKRRNGPRGRADAQEIGQCILDRIASATGNHRIIDRLEFNVPPSGIAEYSSDPVTATEGKGARRLGIRRRLVTGRQGSGEFVHPDIVLPLAKTRKGHPRRRCSPGGDMGKCRNRIVEEHHSVPRNDTIRALIISHAPLRGITQLDANIGLGRGPLPRDGYKVFRDVQACYPGRWIGARQPQGYLAGTAADIDSLGKSFTLRYVQQTLRQWPETTIGSLPFIGPYVANFASPFRLLSHCVRLGSNRDTSRRNAERPDQYLFGGHSRSVNAAVPHPPRSRAHRPAAWA